MSGETTITIIGNLTSDPELRETTGGHAVVNFTVAATPRVFDRQTSTWVDGAALFMRCQMWRDAAENVHESLTKGARVIVTGKLQQRSYDDREGNKRTVVELVADEVGVSLKYAVAKPIKRSHRSRHSGGTTQKAAIGSTKNTGGVGDDPYTGFTPGSDEVA
ncbi:single-stranded DNA-binding protein [Nocardia uniformis]|uniref:Single-stranded DNA-binding protein n=1 Tax=Nocardia uniformis TaxID=53432 RepID=A0A849CB61_9NOCA|nr:single-stranded DNA-binding protein [Nocardia uniformis]NNH75864.1 single-stranded DNA-binding protein [Nocardia uniformis]